MKIKKIHAREILDSRGNPTVECDVELENGIIATASVPSGASTGSREALELRDGDKNRYKGKGVLKAVSNINDKIAKELVGKELIQNQIDAELLKLDGTEFKTNLGANATLAVSLACLKAAAKLNNKELYEFVSNGKVGLPIPMMNIVNGGKHANNDLDIQEFMIVPVIKPFKERLRAGSEVFHTLKKILDDMGLSTGVGDEGGFAPNLKNNEEALQLIVRAIEEAGYKPGEDVFIALDAASSEMYNKETATYSVDKKSLSSKDLMNYYLDLVDRYPIISIEDAFMEDDFDSLAELTAKIGQRIMLVGDDYFVTNKKYLQKAIDMNAGNAILLKANQIGTVSEMMETILLAKKNNYKMVISHRSGETEDTFIADLAVGLDIPYIKTGSLSRGERIAKYNRLLRIEEKLLENN
ncbi:MAG: phosphopyruvate hydratase [bacterium]|nr:phosphopyruvate hydratase [bacterium]